MKTKFSNKKFYNKWYYKVTLEIKGACIFRFGPLENTREMLELSDDYWSSMWWVRQAADKKDVFLQIIDLLDQYDRDSYGIRVESNCVDFYTNQRELFDKLSDGFTEFVKHRFEPKETDKNIIDQKNVISVNKYPHDTYTLKVFLKPHVVTDSSERKAISSWLSGQVPNITFTSSVKNWFEKTKYNYDRRYILVNDEATLLLLKLRCSEAVGAVYRYMLVDK